MPTRSADEHPGRAARALRLAAALAAVVGPMGAGCAERAPGASEVRAGCRLEEPETAACRVYNRSDDALQVDLYVSAEGTRVAGQLVGDRGPRVPAGGFVDVRVPLEVRVAIGQFSNPAPGEVEAYEAREWAEARRSRRLVATVRGRSDDSTP